MHVDGEFGTEMRASNSAPHALAGEDALVREAEGVGEKESVTTAAPATEGFWLSPQQRRIWTLQQGGGSYRTACIVLVQGLLSVDDLSRALRQLVTRHEILRTLYRRQPGMVFPIQVILDSADIHLETADLSGMSAPHQQEQLDTLFREAQVYGFTPEHGPVLAANLAALGPNCCALILSLPALAADRCSLKVLIRELVQLTTGTAATEEGEKPLRYVQFAQWQNDLLDGKDESSIKGQEFWKNNERPSPALPLPHELKVRGRFSPRIWTSTLDPETLSNIESLAARLRSSNAEVLIAAWESLMWRLSGQTTFTLGIVFDGREYEELRDTVGLIEKTIPIDCHFEGEFRFREVVEQVRASIARAAEWQEHYAPGTGFGVEPPISFEYGERSISQTFGDYTFTAREDFRVQRYFQAKAVGRLEF